MQKICTKCQLLKSIDSFSFRNKTKNTRRSWCKECFKILDKIRHNTEEFKNRKRKLQHELAIRIRQFKYDYLNDKCCSDCGENRIACLQFDHNDNKKANISNLQKTSKQTILDEIAKCTIRCANCHAIKTAQDQGWYSNNK